MKKYINPEIDFRVFSIQEILYASIGAEDNNLGGDNLGDNNDFI